MAETEHGLEALDQYDYIDSEYFDAAIGKYSKPLGAFFMRFSSLENELNIAIAESISGGSHEMGYSVVERMGMRDKIDLFFRLYNKLETATDKKRKATLLEIHSTLISINDFRNLLAHANWETIQKNGLVRTRFLSDKETGWIKFKNIVIKTKHINAKVREMVRLADKLWNYKEKALQF